MYVLKAVSENLEIKRRIFGELAAETRPDTILATNTSSISITKIAASAVPQGESTASAVGKRSAGRVIGKFVSTSIAFTLQRQIFRAPFFQPCPGDGEPTYRLDWNSGGLNAHLQKLVELISALQTSEDTLSRARAFAVACDKDVTVSKDVPGFVSNALLMPFINEVNILLIS